MLIAQPSVKNFRLLILIMLCVVSVTIDASDSGAVKISKTHARLSQKFNHVTNNILFISLFHGYKISRFEADMLSWDIARSHRAFYYLIRHQNLTADMVLVQDVLEQIGQNITNEIYSETDPNRRQFLMQTADRVRQGDSLYAKMIEKKLNNFE